MSKANTKILKKRVVKSRTNGNNLCKQYQYVLSDDKSKVFYTIKYILFRSDHKRLKSFGFNELKTFKGVSLYVQHISFKFDTLNDTINWISE